MWGLMGGGLDGRIGIWDLSTDAAEWCVGIIWTVMGCCLER